jgi:hypothetical protein
MPDRYVTHCKNCDTPFMSESKRPPKWCSYSCRDEGQLKIKRQEYIRRGLMRPRLPWQ